MKSLVLFIAGSILGAGIAGCAAYEDRTEGLATMQPVQAVPLVHLDPTSPMEVTVLLQNTSDDDVRYLPAGDEKSADHLHLILSRNGRVMHPIGTEGEVGLAVNRVKSIKPGEHVTHTLRLAEMYRGLTPGRYALDAEMYVSPILSRDYAMTEVRLKQRLLYIEIRSQ